MVRKFRKKPVVIEAVQYDGNNGLRLLEWMRGTECEKNMLGDYVETRKDEL